ncbi:MAG: DUF4390 domain-containing protein, partial [Desulfovibrio sp.]|nr:DUF4390 domain-containing protein [Desulfovibrio sp.]
FRRFAVVLLAPLLALLLPVAASLAVPPRGMVIESPKSHITDGYVFLDLSLSVDSEEGLRDMLKDGAVLQLTVNAVMERKRSFWSNEDLVEESFSSILRHDPLHREFIVLIPSPEGEVELRDRNLTRLIHASWRKLSLRLISLEALSVEAADDIFLIQVDISLRHTDVPPWLEKSTVFWSADVVPSESFSLEFVPPAAETP